MTTGKRIGYYVWILTLTIVLMLLILVGQVLTIRNINGLKTGNREAAVTFTINNRLQEIVNTSSVLEARLLNENLSKESKKAINDSLAVMGYNASVLEKLNVDSATKIKFSQLNALISKQVSLSFKLLDQTDTINQTEKNIYAGLLSRQKSGDSIYKVAVSIEKGLEAKLKNTFEQNTVVSQKISGLNKIFSVVAIAAILILGTIIISRHTRQTILINALEKANEEVEKSAAIKEQFLANMSHEIRTPLNAIKGFSRLLQQTKLDGEQQKFSDIIENSSDNLLSLVNDILDIAKIEAGKMTVEQKEFDLKRMMQTLEQMFMNTAKEKQLDFSWQIDENVLQYLYGDPDRIYQILVNLVSNAFKFTTKGFVKISISNAYENDAEITLQFKVQDSGIGIPLKKQALIFERFQQAGNAEENIQKGTGLGLAIVKNMATLLGGNIVLESYEGKGSLFTVTLPFTKSIIESNTVTKVDVTDNAAIIFKNANVLVAEDNSVNQLLITKLLNQYGIKPVLKVNGVQVLEVLKDSDFDLLLLDIQMPLLDGYKTCIAIRETGNKMPVVAMTAYVMDAEKEKCRSAGMNDYLAKPLDEAELKKILMKYLSEFTEPVKFDDEVSSNRFLLKLAGGDKQMAAIILSQVKQEIPAEIEKLNMIISQKNTAALSAVCHHLISSISPLGNDSNAMKKVTALQKSVLKKDDEKEVLKNATDLIKELENTFNNIKQS